MSTSLLYHTMSLRGYRQHRQRFENGEVTFVIKPNEQRLRCPCCGCRDVMGQGRVIRRWRGLPFGNKRTWIEMAIPRVWCPRCSRTAQIDIGFARPQVGYSKAFERYAIDLGRAMTIQDVARHLSVSWDVIKGIQKRYLEHRFRRIPLAHLRQIAIDEISIGKGHRYLTVVLDLESGAVVFLGEGKGADALKPFWKRLRCARARIEAVASDMSAAYVLAISENLPDAVHVLDRFHVMKLFNEKLADLRRDIHRTTENVEHKTLLKGTRWLLVKGAEHLDPDRSEQQRLERALEINKPLAAAYYLKEDLRRLWAQSTKPFAAAFLDDWIARAEVSGVRMLKTLARTLQLHRTRLLAWYDYPISTGPLEGTNNKIKTMQRQAYGYRDMEFFHLRIHAIHEATYALVG